MPKNATTTAPTPAEIAGAVSWYGQETGDTITGTTLGFEIYEHDEFGKSPVIVLDTHSDEPGMRVRKVYVIGVLMSQFREMGLAVGEDYTAIYLGDKEGKRKDSKGNPIEYHNYASYSGDAPVLATELDMSLFE